MTVGRRPRRRPVRLGRALVALVAIAAGGLVHPTPASAAPSRINGEGSTYVGLAMKQWVAEAQTRGLQISYLPTGSPAGLGSFANSVVDFAGTEAEYTALGAVDQGARRGYQYVPDVAGAVAIMYNVEDKAGKKVTTLQLSRSTVAKIFMGAISSWDDPAITADNKGYALPAQPITVVYRSGQSGTTALFYDFVSHIEPDVFSSWAAKNNLPTATRIISLNAEFAPHTYPLGGSDQIAQYVGSPDGKWTISYDEFGYAKTYKVPAAWIQNQSGNWVQPYAQNIASALKSATLRPDLSQELSGVYASPAADAYPISAYSYLVTQCAPDAGRPTCKGGYDNAGAAETLAQWMRYIACEGQVAMADTGYSPLPPNLSNEITKSIGRMLGTPAEVLTAENCVNPTFKGTLGGPPPPPPPLANVPPKQAGPSAAATGPGSASEPTGGPASPGAATVTTLAGVTETTVVAEEAAAGPGVDPTASEDASGRLGATRAVGGGSGNAWRALNPVAYDRPEPEEGAPIVALFVLGILAVPPLVGSAARLRRR